MHHVFVTGGLGFIGSNFVRLALARWPRATITNYDLMTYAGNPANVADCADDPRYRFVRGDCRDADAVVCAMGERCDVVVHFAAESHVDRSILGSDEFLTSNVLGTHAMLEASRRVGVSRFVFVGTDEVYGSLLEPQTADEDWPLRPRNPYSVSKAAADMLTRAYHVTYGFPAVVTRCSNNYGPFQYPEKLIPLFISNLLEGRRVPLYGDGLNVRDWIHVTDHCEALARVVEDGVAGAVYNIGGADGHTNLEIARKLLAALGKDESHIEYVTDRPGHDRRYAMSSTRITEALGWRPRIPFAEGLASTVQWYLEHREWWEPIKSGAFREYYEKQYGAGRGDRR